jgi:hypothetical protein
LEYAIAIVALEFQNTGMDIKKKILLQTSWKTKIFVNSGIVLAAGRMKGQQKRLLSVKSTKPADRVPGMFSSDL